jgi:PEGA domain
VAVTTETRTLSTSSGFRDGLGERVLTFDRATGELRERLRVRPELGAFEAALGAQIDRVSALADSRFARARDVDRDRVTGQVVVVSDYVAGQRLSDLLDTARERAVFPDMSAALQTTSELLLAMASFSAGLKATHGAIAPARVVITDSGDVVLTDYLFGPVLARLRFSAARLWKEFDIAPGSSAFDEAADLRQIALILVALSLGRPIGRDEYPGQAHALVSEVCEVAGITGGEKLASATQGWLDRALGYNGSGSFDTLAQACSGFAKVMSCGPAASRASLVSFLDDLAADPAEVVPAPAPIVARAPEPPVAEEKIPETASEDVEDVPPVRPAFDEPFFTFTMSDTDFDASPEPPAEAEAPPAQFEVEPSKPLSFEVIAPESTVALPIEPAEEPAPAAEPPVIEPVTEEPPTDIPVAYEPEPEPIAYAPVVEEAPAPYEPVVYDAPVIHEPEPEPEPVAFEPVVSEIYEAVAPEPVADESIAPVPVHYIVDEIPVAAAPAVEEPVAIVEEPVAAAPSFEESREPAVPPRPTPGSDWDEWTVYEGDTRPRAATTPAEPSTIFDPRDPPRAAERPSKKKKKRGKKRREEEADQPKEVVAARPMAPPTPPMQSTLAALAALPEILPPGVVPLPPVARPAPLPPPPLAAPTLTPPPAPQPIKLKDSTPGGGSIRPREEPRVTLAPVRPANVEAPTPARDLFSAATRRERALPSLGVFLKIVAVVVVVILAGVGVSMFRDSTPALENGTLTLESTPPGSDVFVDGQPKGKTPITIPVAAGKHEIRLSRRGANHVVPVVVEAGKAHVERHTWSNVKPAGGLRVTSTPPGATVLIDGKPQGQTPLELPELDVGRHTVVIQGRGGSIRRTVRVTAGEQAVVDVELFSGFLKVFAPVELQLSVRGRPLSSGGGDAIMLPAGTHEILAVNAPLGYRGTHTISVEPGQTANLTIEPTGRLSLNAVPWAEVLIDGVTVGDTPIANRSVPIGVHQIVFRHPEHGERRFTTTVKFNQVATVTADLTRP